MADEKHFFLLFFLVMVQIVAKKRGVPCEIGNIPVNPCPVYFFGFMPDCLPQAVFIAFHAFREKAQTLIGFADKKNALCFFVEPVGGGGNEVCGAVIFFQYVRDIFFLPCASLAGNSPRFVDNENMLVFIDNGKRKFLYRLLGKCVCTVRRKGRDTDFIVFMDNIKSFRPFFVDTHLPRAYPTVDFIIFRMQAAL